MYDIDTDSHTFELTCYWVCPHQCVNGITVTPTLPCAVPCPKATASPLCSVAMWQAALTNCRWATTLCKIMLIQILQWANLSWFYAPQMQVRDYPAPLIAITEITTTGRMVLAEQEARDRGEGACVCMCVCGHIVHELWHKRNILKVAFCYSYSIITTNLHTCTCRYMYM